MKDINIYELQNPIAFKMLKNLITAHPYRWKKILTSGMLPKKNTLNVDVHQILDLLGSIN